MCGTQSCIALWFFLCSEYTYTEVNKFKKNPILFLKVVNQHAKFEEPRFIISQDIVRKPPKYWKRSMAPVTLKSGQGQPSEIDTSP